MWYVSMFPAFRRWRQEDLRVNIIFDYLVVQPEGKGLQGTLSQGEEGGREIQTETKTERHCALRTAIGWPISKRSLLLSHNIKMPTVGKKSWKFIHRKVIHGEKPQPELQLTASTLIVHFWWLLWVADLALLSLSLAISSEWCLTHGDSLLCPSLSLL